MTQGFTNVLLTVIYTVQNIVEYFCSKLFRIKKIYDEFDRSNSRVTRVRFLVMIGWSHKLGCLLQLDVVSKLEGSPWLCDFSACKTGSYLYIKMDGDAYSTPGNGNQMDSKVLQTFQKSFVQVQSILDQNRLLIKEINQNHESKIPDNLSRNVVLIRELNNNIRRVVDLYAGLSTAFAKVMETSSEGDSAGTLKSDGKPSVGSGQKRLRP